MPEPRDLASWKLREIVDSYGPGILGDSRRCRSLLLDLCSGHRSEVNLLELALRERVAADLASPPSGVPRAVFYGWLTRRLQEAYFLPESVASWAVEACAMALRLPAADAVPRRFASSLPVTLLTRPSASTMSCWLERARLPGAVDIAAGHEVKVIARLDRRELKQFAGELRELGSVQELDLSYSDIDVETLAALASLPGLVRLDLTRTGVADAALAQLRSSSYLQDVNLWGCEDLSDAGLVPLGNLHSLRVLDLGRCTGIGDGGVQHLTTLGALQYLGLAGTRVTDQGVRLLADLSALEQLDLAETAITGATVGDLRGLESLVDLSLFRCVRFGNEGMAHLRDVRRLRRINLGACGQLTDAGLVHMRRLGGLQSLSLEETGITDAGLSLLDSCIGMRLLDLSWTRVTDEGAARLLAMSGLMALSLAGTFVGDGGLRILRAFSDLGRLDLAHTHVSDRGMASLAQLPSLKELVLEGTRLTDAGLPDLSMAPVLSRVYLGGTEVTDLGLASLLRLDSLSYLDLTGCEGVTAAGVAQFAERPEIQVVVDL